MTMKPPLTEGAMIKVTRTVTTTSSETAWVTVPEGVDHINIADVTALDDLISDLVFYQLPEVDEEVLDVLDSTAWRIVS